jgi:hypothetical protein
LLDGTDGVVHIADQSYDVAYSIKRTYILVASKSALSIVSGVKEHLTSSLVGAGCGSLRSIHIYL